MVPLIVDRWKRFRPQMQTVLAYEPLELFAVSLTFFWGGWLLLPGDTFDTSHVYMLMDGLAPEEVWGGALCALALFMLWGLMEGGERRVALAAGALTVLWGLIAFSFAVSNPLSTGTITTTHMSLAMLYAFARHMAPPGGHRP